MRGPPVGESVHAGALPRHALVYRVRGQGGRSYDAGKLAGHVQTVSQSHPHVRNLYL
jgi:hypothetical protein